MRPLCAFACAGLLLGAGIAFAETAPLQVQSHEAAKHISAGACMSSTSKFWTRVRSGGGSDRTYSGATENIE